MFVVTPISQITAGKKIRKSRKWKPADFVGCAQGQLSPLVGGGRHTGISGHSTYSHKRRKPQILCIILFIEIWLLPKPILHIMHAMQ